MMNCIIKPIKINECIRKMNSIIKMLNKAKTSLDKNKSETAKYELTEAISESSEVIQIINYLEEHSKHVKPMECDSTGAISLTGKTDLQNGNKYITPSGAIINWADNTITVCEPYSIPPDIWSVYDTPLTIKDVTEKIQQAPMPNVLVFLEDGSSLLVGNAVSGGAINKARFLPIGGASASSNYQGYSTDKTEVYVNDACRSKVAEGTADQVFGV